MGKDVHYKLSRDTKPTKEQIAMIEAARSFPIVYDKDNSEIDPVATPAQYEALMKAVAERNQRITRLKKNMA